MQQQSQHGHVAPMNTGVPEHAWDTVINPPDHQLNVKTTKFVDQIRVYAIAGNGGSGCVAMTGHPRRHIKSIPDGGSGGNGGSVIAVADEGVSNLGRVTHKLQAEAGYTGKKSRWSGPGGGDVIVKVPLGTTVRRKVLRGMALPERVMSEGQSRNLPLIKSDDGPAEHLARIKGFMTNLLVEEEMEVMRSWLDSLEEEVTDMLEPGQRVVLAQGGTGGRGNSYFRHLQPDGVYGQHYELGGAGEHSHVWLELRTIADIGLVGIPNAGKSSLLKALSRANPKIAPYPFTTLRPQLGAVCFPDGANLTVADIPGLIQGASEDQGLGHAFLRHIERTRALALVVDMSVGTGTALGPEPWTQVAILRHELRQYYPQLLQRPQVVVANKIDLFNNMEHLRGLLNRLQKQCRAPVAPVSALFETGVPQLKLGLRQLIPVKPAW